MWKYVVYWLVTATVNVPCDTQPDPYTGSSRDIVLAVSCMEYVEDLKIKGFENREDAYNFYKGGKARMAQQYSPAFNKSGILWIKIDSIKISK